MDRQMDGWMDNTNSRVAFATENEFILIDSQ